MHADQVNVPLQIKTCDIVYCDMPSLDPCIPNKAIIISFLVSLHHPLQILLI